MATTLFYTLNFPAKHLLETTKNHLQPVLRSMAPVISIITVIKTHTHTHLIIHATEVTLWDLRCGGSAVRFLPKRGQILSVLTWPHCRHLMQRMLRTSIPKGWSLMVSSPLAYLWSMTGDIHPQVHITPSVDSFPFQTPTFGPHLRLLVLPLLESSLKQECWS